MKRTAEDCSKWIEIPCLKVKTFMLIIDPTVNPGYFMCMLVPIFFSFLLSEAVSLCVVNEGCYNVSIFPHKGFVKL